MNHDPEQALRAYVRAFETLDPTAVLPFYHCPGLFLAPFGAMPVVDVDGAHRMAMTLIEHARAQGYRRTEIRSLRATSLGANLAQLDGIFVRVDTPDQELVRSGFHCVMRREEACWKVAVAVALDPPAVEA